MAIASVRTLLSLDRFAKIMGINPVHFNGGDQIELSDQSMLFPYENAQNNIWPQHPWQSTDLISREDLAIKIQEAEFELISYLGYNPTPTWNMMEFIDYSHSFRDNSTILTATIQLDKQFFISGGVRSVTYISSPVIGYSDIDNDGWQETATIQIPTPAGIPLEEIKVYFTGHNGEPEFEIRPPKSKAIVGNNIKIVFPTWMMIRPDIWNAYPTNSSNQPFPVDLTDSASLELTVDVYREYNNTTVSYAKIYYHDCTSDDQQVTDAAIFGAVTPMSRVTVLPATFDSTLSKWVVNSSFNGDIDFVRLWYYSGKKERQIIPNVDDYIPEVIAKAISYLATARLENIYYTNNNATSLADNLRRDYLEPTGGFVPSPMDLDSCPFGTTVGEYQAWKLVKFMHRVGKYATI